MRYMKFSATLKYKQVTQSQPEDMIYLVARRKLTCHFGDFAAPELNTRKTKDGERTDKKLWNI